MQPKHASQNACNAGWNPHTKLRSTETQHVEMAGLPLADSQIYHNYYKNYYQLQLPWIFKVFVRQKCQSELKTREKEQKEKVNQTKASDCLHIYNKKKALSWLKGWSLETLFFPDSPDNNSLWYNACNQFVHTSCGWISQFANAASFQKTLLSKDVSLSH